MPADPIIGVAETQREAPSLLRRLAPHLILPRGMCTLALYFQIFPDYPVVIAANRDEYLNRPSTAPVVLQHTPWIFGGKDLVAGGTWLGVNAHGLVAGMLNRHTPQPADPRRRSRGLLSLDALQAPSARQATTSVQHQPADRYNPFNLLLVDSQAAYVVYPIGQTIRVQQLEPGVHLLTNMNLNDPECPKIAHSFQYFQTVAEKMTTAPQSPFSLTELFRLLHERLADHATPLDPRAEDPRNGLCIHLDGYGTCSSTLLAYSSRQRRFIYHFAPGAPCQTDYSEVSVPSGP